MPAAENKFLVGLGVDHHVLVAGEKNSHGLPLTLGGLVIPEQTVSLESNCDGDVIIHALCNAISTAMGGGSLSLITDELCAAGNLNSVLYLRPFLDKIQKRGYQINNIAVSVEAARPKLEKYRQSITVKLAKILEIETEKIGMAFTTGEGLTECGRGKGIYAQVIISLSNL
jgi:2-C-methyl-D-erythritol 2,4-cyclodiphosphate synthase